jgi:hypothetical protein
LIQRGSIWKPKVVRADAEAKAIAPKPRDDVQMDVQDLLAGCLAIGHIQIHSLALDARPPHGLGQLHTHLEDIATGFPIQLGQAGGMNARHYQEMPRVHRPHVHERYDLLVGVDDAGRGHPLHDTAEYTLC